MGPGGEVHWLSGKVFLGTNRCGPTRRGKGPENCARTEDFVVSQERILLKIVQIAPDRRRKTKS